MTALVEIQAPATTPTYVPRGALQSLSPGERRLLNLCLALTDVALSIEKYDAPGPPNAPENVHFGLDTSALD